MLIGGRHKPEASCVIPWFHRYNPKPGHTVLKGRWIQIHLNRTTAPTREPAVAIARWLPCPRGESGCGERGWK